MVKVTWEPIEADARWAVKARAAEFLKGIVATRFESVAGEDGWVRPLRFTAEQERALASCAAWHPALFRSQAVSCAGVRVEFVTSATRIALEAARDAGAAWTGDEAADVATDGLSVDVDGEHIEGVIAAHGAGRLVIELDGQEAAAEPGGEGDGGSDRLVRIWLPYLSGCCVKTLMADAEMERAPSGASLLVIGDSIAQGEDALDPGLSWPARLVRDAGFDVLNQGLLGQVFQPSAVSALAGAADPDLIWMALGANYRHEECYPGTVERDARATLAFVRRQWRDRRTWVATPTPHDEELLPSSGESCWREVPGILATVCERWPQFTLVDGADLLDDDRGYRADADHPNARGHAQMARRIARVLAGEAPVDAAELEARGVPAFLRDMGLHAEGGLPVPPSASQAIAGEAPSEALVEALDIVEEDDSSAAETTVLDLRAVRAALRAQEAERREVAEEPEIVEAEVEPEVVEPEVVEPEVVEEELVIEDGTAAPAPSPELTPIERQRVAAERRVARRKRTIEEDADALLELLIEGPIDSVPLEQVLIRGIGEPTYVSEGFCSVDLPNGSRIYWGEDVIEARRVMSRQRRPSLAICLSPGLEPTVRRIYPTDEGTLWYTLAVYEGTEALPVESDLKIRPLDHSWAGVINRTYSFPGGLDGAELARILGEGIMLGGFDEDDQLVGYIGEWAEGAMGLLEVLPHARRRGYGSALEATKANQHLARGWTPFCQVMEGNDASMRLQRALGFTIAEQRQCYIPMA